MCPSKLETYFEGAGGCASVQHIFIVADPRLDRVVAIVRPSVAAWARVTVRVFDCACARIRVCMCVYELVCIYVFMYVCV